MALHRISPNWSKKYLLSATSCCVVPAKKASYRDNIRLTFLAQLGNGHQMWLGMDRPMIPSTFEKPLTSGLGTPAPGLGRMALPKAPAISGVKTNQMLTRTMSGVVGVRHFADDIVDRPWH